MEFVLPSLYILYYLNRCNELELVAYLLILNLLDFFFLLLLSNIQLVNLEED